MATDPAQRELIRALRTVASDFDAHLDGLTEQLTDEQGAAVLDMLDTIEKLWPERPAQLNVCHWLICKVRLGRVADLAPPRASATTPNDAGGHN